MNDWYDNLYPLTLIDLAKCYIHLEKYNEAELVLSDIKDHLGSAKMLWHYVIDEKNINSEQHPFVVFSPKIIYSKRIYEEINDKILIQKMVCLSATQFRQRLNNVSNAYEILSRAMKEYEANDIISAELKKYRKDSSGNVEYIG